MTMALLSLKAFNELHMSSNLQHKFEAQIKMWLFFSQGLIGLLLWTMF